MPNTIPTPANLEAVRIAAGRLFSAGREVKNYATSIERICRDAACQHGQSESRQAEIASLPDLAQRLADNADAIANALPDLNKLAVSNASRSPVDDFGSSVVVRYKKPTDRRGAGWIATLWRDRECTFRATSSFTYENKDNDGADTAAERCLAKFAAFCNSGEHAARLGEVSFKLKGRVSLGNGSYAYTFTR